LYFSADGYYKLPYLPAGKYNLAIEKDGFSLNRVADVPVLVGQISTINVTLKPGSVHEEITVTANAVQIDQVSSSLGYVAGATQIIELPTNRSPYSLMTLSPGVIATGNTGTGPIVNGGRSNTSAILFDGQDLVRILRNTAERCGLSLDGHQVCLELGCGVGRVTVWLAELFHHIVAADISPLRLKLNKRALHHYQRTNVNHYCLESIDAVSSLPDYDVFYSVIVLQHNPPPIIVKLLKLILRKLRVGGIAYFQLPTFMKNYYFQVDEYIRKANGGPSHMEMHCIPQKLVFDIVRDAGCELLEIREDPWTESNAIISNSLLVSKPTGT